MQPRDTGLSLAITLGIMLALGVVAAVFRARGTDGRGASEHGGGAETAPVRSAELVDSVPNVNPLDPPPRAEWTVLTGCELVPNKTNAAHHFHVRRGDDLYVFRLYFTEAPELAYAPALTASRSEHDGQVEIQARYFGLADRAPQAQWQDELARLGRQAWARTEAVLSRKPFVVFTMYKHWLDTHQYFAFVYVEDDNGHKRYLQDLLVSDGLVEVKQPTAEHASPDDEGPLTSLPDGTSSTACFEHLQNLQREAQQARVGAWAPRR